MARQNSFSAREGIRRIFALPRTKLGAFHLLEKFLPGARHLQSGLKKTKKNSSVETENQLLTTTMGKSRKFQPILRWMDEDDDGDEGKSIFGAYPPRSILGFRVD